jgi:hypothetical protein
VTAKRFLLADTDADKQYAVMGQGMSVDCCGQPVLSRACSPARIELDGNAVRLRPSDARLESVIHLCLFPQEIDFDTSPDVVKRKRDRHYEYYRELGCEARNPKTGSSISAASDFELLRGAVCFEFSTFPLPVSAILVTMRSDFLYAEAGRGRPGRICWRPPSMAVGMVACAVWTPLRRSPSSRSIQRTASFWDQRGKQDSP